MTLEEMQAQLDVLQRLRRTGNRAVEYAGRRVEYRTDAELAAAIADLERRIAGAQTSRPARVVYLTGGKGLC